MIQYRTTSGEVIQPPPYTPKAGAVKKGGVARPEPKAEATQD